MTTSKTSSFYLTETVLLDTGSVSGAIAQGTMDIGGLVNIANSEALAIEQVDFIHQAGPLYNVGLDTLSADAYCVLSQVSDQNPGTALIRADDNNLIGSGAVNVDVLNNIVTNDQDFFPDNFGKLSEAFFAVNDSLYLVAAITGNGAPSLGPLYVTVRIKARIAKLSKQDWMALAITSTANSD
jgi:hypothetical protein